MAGALRSDDLRDWEKRATTVPREDPLRTGELDRSRQLSRDRNLQLREVAAKIGGILGRAAAQVQRTPEVRGRVLLNRAGEIRDRLAQRAREMQQAARLRIQELRVQGERLVRERPLHVLAAIGGAGFVLGVVLRIVRSRNARRY